jgi:uncharacterized protein (TIGR02145 family)
MVMKKIFLFLAFTCGLCFAQSDMMNATRNQYNVADLELNAVYQQLMKSMSKEEKAALRKEQRAWIPLRDSSIDSCNPAEEGAMCTLSRLNGLAIFTKRRVAELRMMQRSRARNSANSFTDARDTNVYATIKIGAQTWMAENLNYAMKEGSSCYREIPELCSLYGRLYTWEAAQKACPAGWHLPSDDEWQALIKAVGDSSMAGKALKSKNGWIKGGNGTDSHGFSALPGGCVDTESSVAGECASWWSTGKAYSDYGNYWYAYSFYDGLYRNYDITDSKGSIRCVKD